MNKMILCMAAGVSWRSVFQFVFHMPCLFHLLTGWYCPGCGGTRAVKYLLQGHLYLSFLYHPLVLYAAAAAVLKLGTAAAAKATGHREYYVGYGNYFAYGALAVVAVNWAVKNYLLIVKGIDLLSAPL